MTPLRLPQFLLVAAVFMNMLLLAALPATLQAAEARDKYGYLHIKAPEAAQIVAATPDIIILDIRTAEEFADGHLAGAVNIDYYAKDFAAQLAALDPAARYLLHCRSGNRSGRALPVLKELGFSNVTHLDGGILAWTSAGQPLARN